MTVETLILSRGEVAALMTQADWRAAVEAGFLAEAEGAAASPAPMTLEGAGGSFHGKGATLRGARAYAALKFNGNFPNNARFGLPTVQGALLLADAADGRLLAVVDSIEITLRRTAAASALAAGFLARRDSRVILFAGCGAQARAHAEAFAGLYPFEEALAFDIDFNKAERFAREAAAILGARGAASPDVAAAARRADVIVTTTPASAPFLFARDIAPGTFIAAVGADNPRKSEIAPDLMAAARIVCDSTAQCVKGGDLRAATLAGAVSADCVHATLADLVSGRKRPRRTAAEVFVFDSTGTAVEDVASAAYVFERAVAAGSGLRMRFAQ